MSDLRIEKHLDELEQKIKAFSFNVLHILSYNYASNEWDFTLINPKNKALYLPFKYRKKKINFIFYYQTLYTKFRRKK